MRPPGQWGIRHARGLQPQRRDPPFIRTFLRNRNGRLLCSRLGLASAPPPTRRRALVGARYRHRLSDLGVPLDGAVGAAQSAVEQAWAAVVPYRQPGRARPPVLSDSDPGRILAAPAREGPIAVAPGFRRKELLDIAGTAGAGA